MDKTKLTEEEKDILSRAGKIMARLSHSKNKRPKEYYQRIQALRKTHGRQKPA